MFTVKGRIRTKTYSVTYDAGKLTGDRVAVDLVSITAATIRGPVGPIGTYFEKDYLKEPLAALFIMLEVFDEVLEISGDMPEADDVPDGAIC